MSGHDSPRWRRAGACASADPDLFFPISTTGSCAAQVEQALRICAECLVRQTCLEFAMEHGEMEGIWGGTTSQERIRARRAMTASRRHRERSEPKPQAA